MSSVDWRGVAMALSQLKDIAGPTELQKMQFQSDLAEGRAENTREFAADEKRRDRMLIAAENKFKLLYEKHENYEKEIATKRTNIMNISSAHDLLSEENMSPGKDFTFAVDDIEKTPLRQAEQNVTNIDGVIKDDITEMTRLVDIEKGMQFGRELRISEGAAAFQQVNKLYKDGKITKKQYEHAKNYDTNKIAGVEHPELQAGLANQLKLMKLANMPTLGVEEGYWSEYKGQTAKEVEGMNYEQDLYATIAAATEKGANAKILGTANVLNQDQALKLIDEYMNMTQSVYNDPAWYLQLPEDEKKSYHEEIGKLAETLSGSEYGHLLNPIWVSGDDGLKSSKADHADYTADYFPGYNSHQPGRDQKAYEGFGLTYDAYMNISKGNLKWEGLDDTTNRMKNHQLRSAFDFMMRNWDRGGPKDKGLYKTYIPADKRDDTYNPTGQQKMFDKYLDSLIRMQKEEFL